MILAVRLRTCLALSVACAAPTLAQSLQVTAAGHISLSWQGSSGPVQTRTQTIANQNAILSVSLVATTTWSMGTVSQLTVDAISPPYTCYGCWSESSGGITLRLAAATPVSGILRLSMAPRCLMGPVWIDVDGNSTWEIGPSGPTTLDVPVVLGPEPVPVSMYAQTVNFGGATCTYTARIEFLPQATRLGTYGNMCGAGAGASLTTAGSGARTLTLRCRDVSGPVAGLLLGTSPLPVHANCDLLLGIDAWLLLVPNMHTAQVSLQVRAAVTGRFLLQFLDPLPTTGNGWSNGLIVTLP